MARYTGPKQRLQRQVGEDLSLKTNPLKTAKRLAIKPGQHGAKHFRRLSDYGNQLKEKQKVKYLYGILEKQLHKLYEVATKGQTNTGESLIKLLERRLDNVVFRLGWAPTRAAARQLISHNHVLVNNQKLNVPSYQVKIGDVLKIKEKATKIPVIAEKLKNDQYIVPAWLTRKHNIGSIVRFPEREEVAEKIEEQLIVEFYSR